jgi:hypothetical protein
MNDRDDRDMVKIRARARGRLTFAQNYKYLSSIKIVQERGYDRRRTVYTAEANRRYI